MKLLAERGLSLVMLSQISGISMPVLSNLRRGIFSFKTVDTLCRVLDCQPCDIIEFTKSDRKGHWEWISDID